MNRKTEKILIVIYILSILSLIVAGTYAYFTVIKVSQVSPKIEVKSATTEVLSFNISKEIKIIADSENFSENAGYLSSIASVSAYMGITQDNPNYDVFTYTHYYNLKLDVNSNTFIYTTPDHKPELLLSIIDPNDEVVTELAGLEYKTINGASGFDITNLTEDLTIATHYKIETKTEVTHNWQIEVTLVNLDTNQNANIDKGFDAKLVIEKGD